jgi:hypothetical protein
LGTVQAGNPRGAESAYSGPHLAQPGYLSTAKKDMMPGVLLLRRINRAQLVVVVSVY